MEQSVQKGSMPSVPVLMCAAPGYDPSFRVDQLVKKLGNRKYEPVAIGSQESYKRADKAIEAAASRGSWVLLKNVHLAPRWLSQVEKKINRLKPHKNFKLFLTMEFNPKVPTTLIRESSTFVFEPPDGIKASMSRTFRSVLDVDSTNKQPVERSRLHFMLAWLHAVI